MGRDAGVLGLIVLVFLVVLVLALVPADAEREVRNYQEVRCDGPIQSLAPEWKQTTSL